MKDLLSPEHTPVLARLSCSRTLLAFDYDGTLAPIVVQRDAAGMRERTTDLLAQLCALYPCAVISGRARDDVGGRLGAAKVKYVMGNHGAEPGAHLLELEQEMLRARLLLAAMLADRLQSGTDVELEDKRYSLSLHYRKSAHKEAALAAIAAAVASLPSTMRVVPGKLVVNIVSAHARHKGEALLALCTAEQAEVALYVGDDVTDEDVFALEQPGRLVCARVGESRASAAPYFLESQAAVDILLTRLVALRQSPRGA
jgi:trehalose 6-phosphate phosphatase